MKLNLVFGRLDEHRGFTLVELLIVIIIIGVLAGMMLVSSGAATDNARATRIISDIRAMKAAAILYHANYGTWPIWVYSGGKYSNYDRGSAGSADLPGNYFDTSTIGEGYWIGVMRNQDDPSVCFGVADVSSLDSGVRKAIENKARSIALYSTDTIGGQNVALDSLQPYTSDKDGVLWIISK